MELKYAVLRESRIRGIDPYRQPFKPSDLGIRASDYGSFSDHCADDETVSGKWNPEVIFRVVERTQNGRPRRYLLLREGEI
jgi:hypothetical protein